MTADRIQRRHLSALRYCARGSRLWFQKHGYDWGDFCRNGIEREKFVRTGDAMAMKAVYLADAEAARGQ